MQFKVLCYVHDRLYTNLLLASAAAAASLVKTWMWRSRPAGTGFLSCMDADAASLTMQLSGADCALLTAVCVWLLSAEEVLRPFETVLLPCSCAALAGAGEVSDCAGDVVVLGAYITAGDASRCAASLLAGGGADKGGGGSAAGVVKDCVGMLGADLSVSPSLC
jgi:hypothetical protein